MEAARQGLLAEDMNHLCLELFPSLGTVHILQTAKNKLSSTTEMRSSFQVTPTS